MPECYSYGNGRALFGEYPFPYGQQRRSRRSLEH
jgi:hypothetical protein